MIAHADSYHVSQSPDGVRWDGIEYWDEAAGKGVVFAFRGRAPEAAHKFVLKVLRPVARYKLRSEDGSIPEMVVAGEALLSDGITVCLGETEGSEIIQMERQSSQ